MERISIDSSVIASLTYDETSSTLEVEFRSGRIYRYFKVPFEAYLSLVRAESVGGHFNATVRDRYPHEELEIES